MALTRSAHGSDKLSSFTAVLGVWAPQQKKSVSTTPSPPAAVPVLNPNKKALVSKIRDYDKMTYENVPLFTFGSEGSLGGQLLRPWGICCDKRGRILIADRSNNRVQIYTPNGDFVMTFGKFGSKTGELNRPAGITTNSFNQIIVADKDNHRIQIFTEEGYFVFKFGCNGRHVGQFNYPWDVACNSRNHIAVSDTRNHRVQIFSMEGRFLRKCIFDGVIMGKNMYSPRGVCYLPDGSLVVTDFNGHRIAVLDVDKQVINVRFYGSEGHSLGKFCRPQGVCLDHNGNLLVVDTRNGRFQALDSKTMRILGTVDYQFGLDRPSDICVGLDGRVYLVDFGHNRICVF